MPPAPRVPPRPRPYAGGTYRYFFCVFALMAGQTAVGIGADGPWSLLGFSLSVGLVAGARWATTVCLAADEAGTAARLAEWAAAVREAVGVPRRLGPD